MLNTIVVFVLFLIAVALVFTIGYAVTKQIRASNYISSTKYGQLVQLLQDKHELHRFGIGQYLKRQYGEFSAFHLSFLNMGTLTITFLFLGYILYYVSLSLALCLFLLVGIGYMATSAVNAQFISSQPTSGGLYHVALRRSGAVLASLVGVLKLISQLATIILYSYATASLISFIFLYPKGLALSKASFFLIMGFIIVTQIVLASLKSALTRWIQGIGMLVVWLSIIVLVLLLTFYLFRTGYSPVQLLAMEQNSLFTLQELTASSVALVVILLAKWFTGHDEAASGAEETLEPRIKTAWSVYLANSYTLVIGFILFVLACCFYMNVKLQADITNAMSWLFYIVEMLDGIFVLILLLCLIVSWYSGMFAVVNSSRLLLAMARDRMLPAHHSLSIISLSRQTPHIALIGIGILSIIGLVVCYFMMINQMLLELTYVIIATYSLSYAIVHYFCQLAEKEETIWRLPFVYPVFRFISIFFQLILFSISIYYLSWEISLSIGCLLIVAAIYTSIKLGNVKQQLKATSGNEFELERSLPLQ